MNWFYRWRVRREINKPWPNSTPARGSSVGAWIILLLVVNALAWSLWYSVSHETPPPQPSRLHIVTD